MSAARRLALGLWLAVAVVPVIADEAPVKATVTVLVTPPAVQPGEGVTVSGIAPLDAKGAVTVRITPPGGKPPVELRVNPSANGDYSVNFRGTTWAGEYKVGAVSPGGRVTGQGVFTVAVMEPLNEIDEAGQEARKIEAEIRKVTADIDTQVALLPATPEASQLKAKWSTLKPQLLQAARDAGDIDGLLEPLPAAARQDPGLRPALLPFAKKLDDWTKLARPERERISRELAKSKHANIKCENLERLKEGFNYAAALLNLTGGLINAIKSVAVDYVAAQVAKTVDEKAKAFSKNFGFPAGESTKVAIAFTEAAAKGKWGGNKTVLKLAAKETARGSVFGVLADAAAFAADRLFNASCERMSGPIQGFMHADFFASSTGEVWWNYDIHYSGKLELRYPKNANSGEASSVTGEFMGQATKFTLWEDSMRIGFPGLTSSAIKFKRVLLPRPQLFASGSAEEGTTAGSEEKPIDVEGKVAATFLKPYSFYVPVEGEIVKGVLTLRIKPATSDYNAVARVVYVFISPLANFVPVATTFELPYKEANFFFTRVSKGGPLQFPVVKAGNSLKVEGTAKNKQGNNIAEGFYQLKIKLCNPEGSC